MSNKGKTIKTVTSAQLRALLGGRAKSVSGGKDEQEVPSALGKGSVTDVDSAISASSASARQRAIKKGK
jgi:hypothetical protein